MVLALENTKTTQALEIKSLKRKVKKLERGKRSRTHGVKRLYKVGLSARVESSKDEGLEVVADKETLDEITLAKALEDLKTLKPRIRGIVIKDHEEPSKSITTPIISSQQPSQVKLQAEEEKEEERVSREKAQQVKEVNIAWDDVQLRSLKNKSFAEIQELFDKEMKRINTFVDYKIELVMESSKKAQAEVRANAATQNLVLFRSNNASSLPYVIRAASQWLRNEPAGSIDTWKTLKKKFLSKYCPPALTAKKMKEINNLQQEPNKTLYQAWERLKELLIRCPQHYFIDMHKVILFDKGLDAPTRQIFDSNGAIPSVKAADAKKAIQDMADHS
uniref:Retrotransposon gag domain-containing protein n=1 Tax=Tanacetum cinerariifolium TaxID=118510 RepID=A0A699HY12_TANCI|nr:hypothetical protein [Tanacetum cinerariifolium]